MKEKGIRYIEQHENDAIFLTRIAQWAEFCDVVEAIKKHPSQPTSSQAVGFIEANAKDGQYALALSVYHQISR